MHNTALAPAIEHSNSGNPLPRFANDWVSAWLQFDASSNLLHVGAGPHEWLLEPVDPTALRTVLGSGRQLRGEFNPDLKIALIPGAHQQVGTSFFRLHA